MSHTPHTVTPSLVNYVAEEKAWALAKVRTKMGLLTFDEVSGILGYARSFLKEEIERGNLQATGQYRARRILAASVADYIERAQQQAKPSTR